MALPVTLNASDTINAKHKWERHASDMGVEIDSYHTDNGIYKSKAFTEGSAYAHANLRKFHSCIKKYYYVRKENLCARIYRTRRTKHERFTWQFNGHSMNGHAASRLLETRNTSNTTTFAAKQQY